MLRLALSLWCAHAGQAVRAERPYCVGPSGCPAVLRLIGVWLNSLRSNNASPDPITLALLSHTEGIARPAPFVRLGGLVTVGGIQQPDFIAAGLLLYLWEQTMYIQRGLRAELVERRSRIPRLVLWSASRLGKRVSIFCGGWL